MSELLRAFNAGDLAAFAELRPKWSQNPDLAAAEQQLRCKITLLCLMEMTFRRPANQRCLSFQEVANATQLPLDEVKIDFQETWSSLSPVIRL